MWNCRTGFVLIAILAAGGCAKSDASRDYDASGLYVAVAERSVSLIQLVQSPDGKLTGRVQESTITPAGTINEISAHADGSIAGHDLVLRPESVWYGGVEASGTVSGDKLTLAGTGFTLTAVRSSFKEYQDAVEHLRSVAATEHQHIAVAQAAQAEADKRITIMQAANQLRVDAAKLINDIDHSPNFGQQAAANTARIAKMLRASSTLSSDERSQLTSDANQIESNTNEIEAARSEYAFRLNQIIQDAGLAATGLQKTCATPQMPQFAVQCKEASSALTAFQAAVTHGQQTFTPYKKQVQSELNRQAYLIQRLGD
jgi:hypothetical protein